MWRLAGGIDGQVVTVAEIRGASDERAIERNRLQDNELQALD